MSEQSIAFPLEPGWRVEFDEIQQRLRGTVLLGGISLLGFLGVLFLMCIESLGSPFWVSISVLTSYLGATLAYFLRRQFPRLAAGVVAGALLGVIALLLWRVHRVDGLYLLILPVGFLTLSFGVRTGAALAALLSMLVFAAPKEIVPFEDVQRGILILMLWAVMALVGTGLWSLLQVIEWAWQGYRTSLDAFQRARSSQGQLQDSLENLKEANQQLNRLSQLAQNLRLIAEEERRIKEEFVANVSHELRTPLNMIIGFCGLILQSPQAYGQPLPPKLLVDLEIIFRNSQHLSNLIDDVLDMSQIDAGKMALTKEKTPMPEVIHEAATAVQPLFHSKGLYLRVNVPDTLPWVWCDRTRIREVLMNLLSNAGRFTQAGGITLSAEQKEGYLVISVADTGPGMTSEEKSRLFRPFEQLDNSIRRRFGGTGLGLSISKSFVEMHDGKIWVESEKNVGTTFFFQLPLEPLNLPSGGPARWLHIYTNPEAHRPYHLDAADRAKPRILVMEKGSGMRKLLLRHFPAVDFSPVDNLEDALRRIEPENAIALLVNDSLVAQSLDRLRQSGRLPIGIPAIVCSIAGEAQASAEFGVANYLVKPIRQEVLLGAIDSLQSQSQKLIRTILVVDDEPDARQLFKRVLDTSDRSFQVVRAEDGEEALDVLQSRAVDLILLDLSMPNLDGFQFLAVKNADSALKEIPVILISARDPYGHPITSSALGVTCGNGLSTRQLIACIEALMAILAPVGSVLQSPPAAPAG